MIVRILETNRLNIDYSITNVTLFYLMIRDTYMHLGIF